MPYIKKEFRARYDNVIKNLKLDLNKDNLEEIRYFLNRTFSGLYSNQIDGHLNYFFSKLLKSLIGNSDENYEYCIRLIRLILTDVYCSPPRYYKLQRLFGLFTCMLKEFERRNWSLISIKILGDLADEFFCNIYEPYEDGKIRDNGDI